MLYPLQIIYTINNIIDLLGDVKSSIEVQQHRTLNQSSFERKSTPFTSINSSYRTSDNQSDTLSASNTAGIMSSSSNNGKSSTMRLRVAGLGHYCEIDISPTATLSQLKSAIEEQTDLPTPYQRLIAKRKKMDDDSMILGESTITSSNNSRSSNDSSNSVEKTGIGLTDQTKILLLHSSLYQRDKDGLAQLTTHLSTINKIDEDRKCNKIDNKTTQELISKLFINMFCTNMKCTTLYFAQNAHISCLLSSHTIIHNKVQVLCKIDGVDTNGSDELRKIRRRTVRKAEDVASRSEQQKD